MNSQQHYAKAPITEALIDFRVEFSSEVNLDSLKDVQRSVEPDYPIVENIILAQGQFQAGSSVSASASQRDLGYRFLSNDRKRILQARLDGFTFSQLEPYHNWGTLQSETQRLWKVYRSVTQPKTVRRVAVRYINRLDLPIDSSGFLDFKDYLQTVPEVSPALSQGLSDYFMQLQIPQEDLQALLIINEAMLPPLSQDTVSLLLDIDLFSTVEFAADSDAIWSLLEKFRDRKNEVFEACITDKTRDLLKQ
jgi:uncharacterized protein (TIGR04255 family)